MKTNKAISILLIIVLFMTGYIPTVGAAPGSTFTWKLVNEASFVRPVMPGDILHESDPYVNPEFSKTWLYQGGNWVDAANSSQSVPYSSGTADYTRNYFETYLYVEVSGTYTIKVKDAAFKDSSSAPIPPENQDSTLFLYEDSFDPSQPLNHLVAGNDNVSSSVFLSSMTVELQAGKLYTVVMSSFEEGVTGVFTVEATGVGSAAIGVPIGPIKLIDMAKSTTTATLHWTAPIVTSMILLQQSLAGQSNWTTVYEEVGDNGTVSATVTGLSPGTSYEFQLIVADGPNAGYSNVVSLTTDTDMPADSTPPTLASAARNSDTTIVVTLSEDATGIAKANDGGFTVVETGGIAPYAVSAIAQGVDAQHVVLTVANIAASSQKGVTVKYTAGGNGTVADLAGNALATDYTGAAVTAWDTPVDTIKPIITRNGSATLRIEAGASYADAGATATDDLDGSVTGSIVTSGTVDTNTPGVYRIRYNVSDAAGNAADEVTRVVTVAPAAVTATGGTNTITVSHAMNGAIVKLYNSSNVQVGTDVTAGIAGTATFSGVPTGTGYYATQKVNGIVSDASNIVSVTAPVSITPTTDIPKDDGVAVIVNGVKQDKSATAKVDTIGDKKVTTIRVDEQKLNDKLDTVDPGYKLTIPVNNNSDKIVGELSAQMIKNMESKEAVLEVKTENAGYTIPADQVNVSAIAHQFGTDIPLEDIQFRIEIVNVDKAAVQFVPGPESKIELIAPAFDFNITAVHDGKEVKVEKFNAYVERMVAIPNGVDPHKITTGVVIQNDGTIVHVPTKVIEHSGRYYAVINSLSNSVYSVIFNQKTFNDIQSHWAKKAIEDMASRLVIAGKTDAAFRPDADITRAEFTAIMVRALGLHSSDSDRSFSDVKSSDWFAPAVQIAVSYGLIEGYEDGTFKPNARITREQAMAIVARAMQPASMDTSISSERQDELIASFEDKNQLSNWAKLSAALNIRYGIFKGDNNELRPQDYITRAETASVAQNILQQAGLINK